MGLNLALIREAHARIKDKIKRTPVLTSATLDAQAHAQLFFKCENFQKGGAFKARGATNAVFLLSAEEARHGVATHSSGNHAAALARELDCELFVRSGRGIRLTESGAAFAPYAADVIGLLNQGRQAAHEAAATVASVAVPAAIATSVDEVALGGGPWLAAPEGWRLMM